LCLTLGTLLEGGGGTTLLMWQHTFVT